MAVCKTILISHFRFPYFQVIKPLTTHTRFLEILIEKVFKNIVGKGENDGNQHSPFPKLFLNGHKKQIQRFELYFFCCLQKLLLPNLTLLTITESHFNWLTS